MRIGLRGLGALAILAALGGCASSQEPASEQYRKNDLNLHVDIDLDGKLAMKVTDRETGMSVSSDDSCQVYNQSSPEIVFLYKFLACSLTTVRIDMASVESRLPEPESSLCLYLIAPDSSSRLKRTMDSYCVENPAQPIENAFNLYWGESLKKGAFD